MLNINQKAQIDGWLNDKMTIKSKRDHNRMECDKLAIMMRTEQNEDNYKTLSESLTSGRELVANQTTQLNMLSMQAIADRLGVPCSAVVYYEKASNIPKVLTGFERKKANYEARKAAGIHL